MEIRVLNYFLAVAREQSIASAAESLHLTQPTLSRQLRDLEDELGKVLFIRGNKKITLTEDGMFFRKRAEEIVTLVKKTEQEMTSSSENISGDIYIGSGETEKIEYIADIAKKLQNKYPDIHFHISSDDGQDVRENLDKGLIDFGILLGEIDRSKYNYLSLPVQDIWGVLMKKSDPLAMLDNISPKDLIDKPLIISRQSKQSFIFSNWFKTDFEKLNIVATYNLVYNASILVKKDIGYAITLDKLINTTGDSELTFVPLKNMPSLEINVVWKKYQIFSKSAEKFLEFLTKATEKFDIK